MDFILHKRLYNLQVNYPQPQVNLVHNIQNPSNTCPNNSFNTRIVGMVNKKKS